VKIEITPEILVTDTSPLIHLAAIDCLHLLNELGHVTIVDMVRHEATGDQSKPFAREVAAWIAEGEKPGSNRPVTVAQTETGEAFRLARLSNPDFKMPNGGEVAIAEWLSSTLDATSVPALVVYEDKKLPRLVELQGMSGTVYTVTTRAVLRFAEERGLIESEAKLWNRLTEIIPTASPENRVQVIKPRGPSTF
jgi:hypothetical protein